MDRCIYWVMKDGGSQQLLWEKENNQTTHLHIDKQDWFTLRRSNQYFDKNWCSPDPVTNLSNHQHLHVGRVIETEDPNRNHGHRFRSCIVFDSTQRLVPIVDERTHPSRSDLAADRES